MAAVVLAEAEYDRRVIIYTGGGVVRPEMRRKEVNARRQTCDGAEGDGLNAPKADAIRGRADGDRATLGPA